VAAPSDENERIFSRRKQQYTTDQQIRNDNDTTRLYLF